MLNTGSFSEVHIKTHLLRSLFRDIPWHEPPASHASTTSTTIPCMIIRTRTIAWIRFNGFFNYFFLQYRHLTFLLLHTH